MIISLTTTSRFTQPSPGNVALPPDMEQSVDARALQNFKAGIAHFKVALADRASAELSITAQSTSVTSADGNQLFDGKLEGSRIVVEKMSQGGFWLVVAQVQRQIFLTADTTYQRGVIERTLDLYKDRYCNQAEPPSPSTLAYSKKPLTPKAAGMKPVHKFESQSSRDESARKSPEVKRGQSTRNIKSVLDQGESSPASPPKIQRRDDSPSTRAKKKLAGLFGKEKIEGTRGGDAKKAIEAARGRTGKPALGDSSDEEPLVMNRRALNGATAAAGSRAIRGSSAPRTTNRNPLIGREESPSPTRDSAHRVRAIARSPSPTEDDVQALRRALQNKVNAEESLLKSFKSKYENAVTEIKQRDNVLANLRNDLKMSLKLTERLEKKLDEANEDVAYYKAQAEDGGEWKQLHDEAQSRLQELEEDMEDLQGRLQELSGASARAQDIEKDFKELEREKRILEETHERTTAELLNQWANEKEQLVTKVHSKAVNGLFSKSVRVRKAAILNAWRSTTRKRLAVKLSVRKVMMRMSNDKKWYSLNKWRLFARSRRHREEQQNLIERNLEELARTEEREQHARKRELSGFQEQLEDLAAELKSSRRDAEVKKQENMVLQQKVNELEDALNEMDAMRTELKRIRSDKDDMESRHQEILDGYMSELTGMEASRQAYKDKALSKFLVMSGKKKTHPSFHTWLHRVKARRQAWKTIRTTTNKWNKARLHGALSQWKGFTFKHKLLEMENAMRGRIQEEVDAVRLLQKELQVSKDRVADLQAIVAKYEDEMNGQADRIDLLKKEKEDLEMMHQNNIQEMMDGFTENTSSMKEKSVSALYGRNSRMRKFAFVKTWRSRVNARQHCRNRLAAICSRWLGAKLWHSLLDWKANAIATRSTRMIKDEMNRKLDYEVATCHKVNKALVERTNELQSAEETIVNLKDEVETLQLKLREVTADMNISNLKTAQLAEILSEHLEVDIVERSQQLGLLEGENNEQDLQTSYDDPDISSDFVHDYLDKTTRKYQLEY